MGLKFESFIYSVPLAAVPLFRVPPYRGGTAEQFGRFAPAVLRNGAEQCGTAERLSYPQATSLRPGRNIRNRRGQCHLSMSDSVLIAGVIQSMAGVALFLLWFH